MSSIEVKLVDELVKGSSNKRHDVFTWVNKCIRKIKCSNESISVLKPYLQLNELFLYLDSDTEIEIQLSHELELSISELYNLCLCKLQDDSPGKIFESAVLLSNILSEEHQPGSETKKKPRKKSYTFSPAKELSATILIQMFELFGDGLTSLAPLLFTAIFKNLKKMMEKGKSFHATFFTLLMELYSSIVNSCGYEIISETFMTKFTKLSKTIVRELYSEGQDYPFGFLNAIISSWSSYFKQETFLRLHSNNVLAGFNSKFMDENFGSFGLGHRATRVSTAKTIADVLLFYHFDRNLISLADILKFYADIFIKSGSRDIKSGCFESLIHFLGQSFLRGPEVLIGTGYLDVVKILTNHIFEDRRSQEQRLDFISRNLKYFGYMHHIILPRLGTSSKILTLLTIFEENTNTESLLMDEKGKVHFATIAYLQLAEVLMDDLSSSFNSNEHNVVAIKSKLVQLATSENFQIRVHSNKVLKKFLTLVPKYMTEVIESSLEILSTELGGAENFSFAKNHGHAFIIANLIDVADKDYVSYELIMKIIIFSTSIMKETSTNTGSTAYYKELISWIILCGLMNYDDDQFLQTHSSQLFLFWKGILTHTFNYRDEDELYKNIELRNHALTCLLCYLGKIDVDVNVAKQVSFLLTKCSTFNHSISIKTKTIDNVLLHNENRILQIYLKIQDHVKADFNSAVLILIVKNFSDPNLYAQNHQPVFGSLKTIKERQHISNEVKREKEDDVLSVEDLFLNDDGFAYGLSSKLYDFEIDELEIKKKSIIQGSAADRWLSSADFWYDPFEREVAKPITSVLSYDYLILLYGNGLYSRSEEYSPKVTTSIINSSMEIFSLVFPFLNDKIQYSVLESMNSSIFSRNTVTFRSLAIAINCCVAIYGSLKTMQQNALTLEETVGTLLLKILKSIALVDDAFLSRIKAECIGLLTSAVSRNQKFTSADDLVFLTKNCEVLIKDIVDNENPYSRVFNALSLSSIYKYNSQRSNFATTYSLLELLIKDPHPVVHTWSLDALAVFLENLMIINGEVASDLVVLLEKLVLDHSYGIFGSSTWSYNYNWKYNSHRVIGQILSILTRNLGPSLIELRPESREAFQNLLVFLLFSTDVVQQMYATDIFVNLATFKINDIINIELCHPIVRSFIKDANFVGLEFQYSNSIFIDDKSLIMRPFCEKAIVSSFTFFTQLLKLKNYDFFCKDIEFYVWTYLALYPKSNVVITYINEWFQQTYLEDPIWIDKLVRLFNMPCEKLFSQMHASVERYLLNHGSKKENLEDIRDEEETSITQSDDNKEENRAGGLNGISTENDLMNWKARFLYLTLIRELFVLSHKNKNIEEILYRRIGSLIKVCFSASTMNIQPMKKLGIEVLGMLIVNFSTKIDKTDSKYSILEQEEAHIVSALMPAFDKNSSTSVLPCAIRVSAEYLSSGIVPLTRMGRVKKIMVTSLAELVDKTSAIKIGEVIVPTKKSRIEIEVSILNAWAEVTIKACCTKNHELIEFTKGYWDSLVPLWIVSLREYASVQNQVFNIDLSLDRSSTDDGNGIKKLELYKPVWLNFVNAIGCVNSGDKSLLGECLSKDDLSSFVFVLYAECLQNLVKNLENSTVKLNTLEALEKVLLCDVSFGPFFSNGIHEESVEIFDRLVLTGSIEENVALVSVIEALIMSYLKQNVDEERFLSGVDKLYQMLRVLMSIIRQVLPFLKENVGEECDTEKIVYSERELELLRRTFGIISKVVSQFPDVFKLDLYACLLFIVGQIFELNCRNYLVRITLPLLKCVVDDPVTLSDNNKMVTIFFQSIKHIVFEKISVELALTTCLILNKDDRNFFTADDVDNFTNLLIKGLQSKNTSEVALQGVKSIISSTEKSGVKKDIVRRSIVILLDIVQDPEKLALFEDEEVVMEVFVAFTKFCISSEHSNSRSAISICMPILIWFYENFDNHKDFVANYIVELVELDFEDVKFVIANVLDDDQRTMFKEVIKHKSGNNSQIISSTGEQIELKNFE